MYLTIHKVLKKGGESVFCSNCGKQMEDSSAFCPECGMKNENLMIDTNPISQTPNPNMQHSQQPMHGQGIPQNQQVLQNQPLQGEQQPMGQPQMPTNSYPISKGDKESKNVIKFILIAVVMVVVFIMGLGAYQLHVEEQYIDNVKGMEFENEHYGHHKRWQRSSDYDRRTIAGVGQFYLIESYDFYKPVIASKGIKIYMN